MPVPVPEGVEVKIEGSHVMVKGPKGQLSKRFHPDVTITLEDRQIVVTRPSDHRFHRSLHGLTRALLANMVEGVSKGFSKRLEIEGIGYRAEMQGQTLVLHIGYSHPIHIVPPPGITIALERGAKALTVEGVDKESVGEVAARIRAVRKPEHYKGKGIRYDDERVRHKAGKAGRVG
jgi:large subunit ribosomal protein L6